MGRRISNLLRPYIGGKSQPPRVIVFALSAGDCQRAVRYVKQQLPHVSIHLFVMRAPLPETAELCPRVVVSQRSIELVLEAWKSCWPNRAALAVSIWSRNPGQWILKLAPFLFPPFRVLIMNEHGDFFSGTPRLVSVHCFRRVRDRVHSAWHRAVDLTRGSRLFLVALLVRLRTEAKFRLRLALGWTWYEVREARFRLHLALGLVRRVVWDPASSALYFARGAGYYCLAALAHRWPWCGWAAFRVMYGRQSLSVAILPGPGKASPVSSTAMRMPTGTSWSGWRGRALRDGF